MDEERECGHDGVLAGEIVGNISASLLQELGIVAGDCNPSEPAVREEVVLTYRHKYNHIFCVTDMGDWYDKLSQSFRDTAKEVLAKTDIDPNVRCFPKRQMKRITNNYSTTLGRGGFSVVYKGRLDDGRSVAVKQYNWRTQKKEFTKEVIIQSQCSHKNTVRLLGCCVEAAAPILVTEFVPNGNLSDLLHGNSGLLPVTLETRLQIVLDVAEALLSNPSWRCQNILLGDKGVAKLCDFGISRLLSMDSDEYTGFVIGSKGYVDPVFCQTGRLSQKCDVYSFGVVLLELFTRKKGIDDMKVCLAEIFACASRKGDEHKLFDMDIVTNENMEFLQGIGRVALECIKFEVEERPEMRLVLEQLLSLKRSRDKSIHEMLVVRKEIEVFLRGCGFGRFILSKESVDDLICNMKIVLKECASGKAYIGKSRGTPLMAIKMSTAVTEKWKDMLGNEIAVQSRIKHMNVAKLIGYCLDHSDGTVLIYEYGAISLYDVLFGDAGKIYRPFTCDLRLKIAIGAAEGIAHLHSLGVVHGDVSINDILLDHVSSPLVKIAGYGTSGLPDIDKALDSLETGHGKKEHDVYSFGLVLLILFTRKKVSLPDDLMSEPDRPVLLHQEAIRGRRCNHLEMIKSLASRCLT
uniref:Protein kinase domain-containing protein n=1 Tax=Oryza meridionalis TaxID=40149 RepID=A0A0E0EBF0_9ORYZ